MNVGKEIRIGKIIRDKRTIIVPIDHPIEGYYKELENPINVIQEMINGGADAVLLRRGTLLKAYSYIAGKLGVVYRVSGATGTSGDLGDQRILSSVIEALRYGADAVVYTIILGHPKENDMFQDFSRLVEDADEFGLPVIGEVDIWEKANVDRFEYLRQGVRALGEEGASLIKSYFPDYQEKEHYKELIKYSLVPVVAAGGAKMDSPLKVLEFVKAVMDAGAVGTSIGRNIWQYKEPSKMIKAINMIVRKNASVEQALSVLS
ncbi:MAG: class I fructose-bisphosphate aldolase [Nitrososphaeria archaeon]